MDNIEKQIFCADKDICAIIARCNSQNKWELWGLSDVLETGEAKYESRLLSNNAFPNEYDAVEVNYTTSGHTRIKLLQNNNWHEIVLIEHKKAIGMSIEPDWLTQYSNPPLLQLSFSYVDGDESIESLLNRGAGKNPTVLIDQIDAANWNYSQEHDERLLRVVDYFLTNGIDVNAKNEWGRTALMAAANYGNADIVSLLLQNGARVDDKDNYGNMALMCACSELSINVVRLLLANGANVDSECFINVFDQWDLDSDEIQIQIELTKLLLDKNTDVNAKDKWGSTALMAAANRSNVDVVSLLLQNRARVNDKDNDGKTALIYACCELSVDVVRLLLANGAKVNDKDNDGKTALMFAVESKNKSIVEYLIQQGANIKLKDKAGNTALTYAQKNLWEYVDNNIERNKLKELL